MKLAKKIVLILAILSTLFTMSGCFSVHNKGFDDLTPNEREEAIDRLEERLKDDDDLFGKMIINRIITEIKNADNKSLDNLTAREKEKTIDELDED